MTCPPNETLVAFAASDLEPAERERVEAHLGAGCEACARELAAIGELRRLASPELLADAPPWLVERAARIPREERSGALASLLGRVADLVFDTFRDPLPKGARRAAVGSRQVLYRALDYNVDIRVTPLGAGRVRVAGQVLPGPSRPIEAVANLEIALAKGGKVTALCSTNELGEFAFDQVEEEGGYTLYIEVAEDLLLVEGPPAKQT